MTFRYLAGYRAVMLNTNFIRICPVLLSLWLVFRTLYHEVPL